jgi:hypothetical protein
MNREFCCCLGVLYVGEESSESCLLLLPIAKNFVELLKEKVLTLSAEFFGFSRLCLLNARLWFPKTAQGPKSRFV